VLDAVGGLRAIPLIAAGLLAEKLLERAPHLRGGQGLQGAGILVAEPRAESSTDPSTL
jgi:hypothetical protein